MVAAGETSWTERAGPVPVGKGPRLVFPGQRDEITSSGFDDFRQLAPDSFGAPSRTGLRVPPAAGFRYRFLLARADLLPGEVLVGIRQGLEIGAYLGTTSGSFVAPPIYPEVRPVTSESFRFIDGGTTWTLTKETTRPPLSKVSGPNDQDSFVFRDARCALVYAAATFPATPTLPGYLGLDGYTPPAMRGTPVLVLRELRWPWTSSQSNDELWMTATSPETYRLYCDVLQTDPATRNEVNLTGSIASNLIPFAASGVTSDEAFVQALQGASNCYGPVYWAALGRLIVQRRSLRP